MIWDKLPLDTRLGAYIVAKDLRTNFSWGWDTL